VKKEGPEVVAIWRALESGNVSTRVRQAADDAGANRIGHAGEHDRDGPGRILQHRRHRIGVAEDDIGRGRYEFGSRLADLFGTAAGQTDFQVHRAVLNPAQLRKALFEAGEERPPSVLLVVRQQQTDPFDADGLLCAPSAANNPTMPPRLPRM
jgi:hypothetical protein